MPTKAKTKKKPQPKAKNLGKAPSTSAAVAGPEPLPVLPDLIPTHEWKDDNGEVLIVKCTDSDGRGHGGFQYPSEVGASVTAPDYNPRNECGGGIHGWPWGMGLGDGKDPDYKSGIWYVIGVQSDIVGQLTGGSKCKFKSGIVRYRGQWVGALAFTLKGRNAWIEQAARSTNASQTGYRGAASQTGYYGAASQTGYRGAASQTGYRGAASQTGDYGAASQTGDRGAASQTGYCGAAVVTYYEGKARSGEFGCIALAWFNKEQNRGEMRCATTGKDGQLKADTWYQLNDKGEFVEVPGQDKAEASKA